MQAHIVDPRVSVQAAVIGSNSLPELAARIRAEHAATGAALKSSIDHSIAAGELLIEAKAKVPHGGWLPWLGDNCAISERTAQLYMRLAKNRSAIETQMRNSVADLSLNEAAALLMLSSDVRKMLNFFKECEKLPGDEFIERCIAEGITVFSTPGYDPMAGQSEAGVLEWHLFMMFLSFDGPAGRDGGEPKGVSDHLEWLVQGSVFHSVADWLGEEGNKRRLGWGMKAMPEQFKTDWAAFLDQHREWTLPDVVKKLESLQSEFEQAVRSQPRKQRAKRQHRSSR
jgi:hypothetical protein